MAQLEIYTTGGGAYLEKAFNFVAAITNTGEYGALMTAAIGAGIIGFSLKLIWGEGIKDTFKWLMFVIVILTVSVGHKATVVIIDKTNAHGLPYGVIDNVPYGMALMGHFTTKTSNAITERMDTSLSSVDDLGYQKNGLYFGASVIAQTTRWQLANSVYQTSLNNFFKGCIIDGVNLGHVDLDALVEAKYLPDTIVDEAPNSLSYYSELDSAVKSCQDTEGLINGIDAHVTALLTKEANRLIPSQADTTAAKVTTVSNNLDAFLDTIASGSLSAREHIAQTVFIQSLDRGMRGVLSDSANSAAMTDYMNARAEAQTISSYQASSAQATKWLPLMKVAFEFIYFCFFPIALVLMLTPLAISMLKNYFMGLVWLASWEPISSIMHSLVMVKSRDYYYSIGRPLGGEYTDFGVTFANHLGIRSVEADIAALGGSLMALVPFLSFALFYGARQLASASTSMTNFQQSSSIAAGTEAATGNMSLGNVSYGNVGANKVNTSSVFDTGRSSVVQRSGSVHTTNADGHMTSAQGSSQSNYSTNASLGQAFRTSANERYETAKENTTRASMEEGRHLDRTLSTYNEMMEGSQNSTALTDAGGKTLSETDRSVVSNASNSVQSFSDKHGVSRSMALSAGLGVSFLGLAKAGVDTGATSSENYQRLVDSAQTEGLSNELGKMEEVRQSSGYQDSRSHSMGDNWGQRNALTDSARLSQSTSQATSEMQRASNAVDVSKSMSADGGQNLSTVMSNYLKSDMGMSQQSIDRVMNPQTTFDAGQGRQFQQQFLNKLMNDEGMMSSLAGTNFKPNDPSAVFDGRAQSPEFASLPANNTGDGYMAKSNQRRDDVSQGMQGLQGARTAGATQNANTNNETKTGVQTQLDKTIARHMVENGLEGVTSAGSAIAGNGTTGFSQGYKNATDRDQIIRTVIAEAGNQGVAGHEAVAQVIKNRTADDRWADNASDVVRQHKQFSAWNEGNEAQHLLTKYNPGDRLYEQVGKAVDNVFQNNIPDITNGATHYYSPAGMEAMRADGSQNYSVPKWFDDESSRAGAEVTKIGGHIFTGKAKENHDDLTTQAIHPGYTR